MGDFGLDFNATLDLTEYKQGIEEAIRESDRLRDKLNYEIKLAFLGGENPSAGESDGAQSSSKSSSSGGTSGPGTLLSAAVKDKWNNNLAAEAVKMGWNATWDFLSDSVSKAAKAGLEAGGAFGIVAQEYAQSVSEFEKNVDALKISLGEKLMPSLSAGFNLFNWLVGDRNPQLTAFKEASNQAQYDVEMARVAFEMLQNYGDVEKLSPSQRLERNAIINEMETIMPGFALLIDPKTGGFQAGFGWADQEAFFSEQLSQQAVAFQDESLQTLVDLKRKLAVNELYLQAAQNDSNARIAEFTDLHDVNEMWEAQNEGFGETDEWKLAYASSEELRARIDERTRLEKEYETALSNYSQSLGLTVDEAEARFDAAFAELERQGSVNEGVTDFGGTQSKATFAPVFDIQAADLQALINLYTAADEAKQTFVQAVSETRDTAQEIYAQMVDDAGETAWKIADAFDMAREARANGLATAHGVASGLAEGAAAIAAQVAAIQGQLAGLGASAGSAISRAGVLSADLLEASPTSNSNADGLSYVPYNDYLSYLHKGEAVLTAAQADDWRAGRTGADLSADAIASAVSGAVARALSGLTVQMDGQTVGHLVAPTVSSDIAEGMITTRHYAMAW